MNENFPNPSNNETAAALIGGVVGLLIVLAILALIVFIMLTLQKHYAAIPAEHREFDPPGKVWMLLIPLFNIYWMFVVYPGLGRSYRKALAVKGITDVGDAGESVGLWFVISSLIFPPAALILMIMFFLKASDMKRRLLSA